MLWAGWFGFNAGSALAADNAAMAMLVTSFRRCGSLAWMAMEWLRHGKPSVLGIVTGMVAGLYDYTCLWLGGTMAVVIGYRPASFVVAATITEKRIKIDDSLDVFPVHGVGGMLGTILIAVFASPSIGIFSGNGFSDGVSFGWPLYIQLFGVVVTFAFALIGSWVLLKVVDSLVGLRVNDDEETEGLDLVLHDERGYDL